MKGPILVISALCLLVRVQAEDQVKLDSDVDEAASLEKKPVTGKQCLKVVEKVKKSGTYTEESIVPLCSEEVKSGGCAFFAEALSLASSHSDFKAATFCHNMGRAQFCSDIMDNLLESRAVSDMAFGECERAKPQKSLEYCRKIQQMLALSVKQEDLDTMRACYMMEAYTTKAKASDSSPKNRIINSSSTELDNIGKGTSAEPPQKIVSAESATLDAAGKGKPAPPHPKAEGIIAEPIPLDDFGKGKGNTTHSTPHSIVVQPVPLTSVGEGTGNISLPPKPKTIITEPVPLDTFGKGKAAKTTTAVPKNIITEPIPVEQNTMPTKGPTVAPPKGTIVAAPAPDLATVQGQKQNNAVSMPVAMTLPVALPVVQKSTISVQPPTGKMPLQQPGQTVYVISIPPVAANASAAAAATQRQEIVAELLAATQSAVNVSQSQVKVLSAVHAAALALNTSAIAMGNSTNKVAVLTSKSLMKTVPVKASNATVLKHQPKKDQPKKDKTLVGRFLGLFNDKTSVKVESKKDMKANKASKNSKDNKKAPYAGFLSGFVS